MIRIEFSVTIRSDHHQEYAVRTAQRFRAARDVQHANSASSVAARIRHHRRKRFQCSAPAEKCVTTFWFAIVMWHHRYNFAPDIHHIRPSPKYTHRQRDSISFSIFSHSLLARATIATLLMQTQTNYEDKHLHILHPEQTEIRIPKTITYMRRAPHDRMNGKASVFALGPQIRYSHFSI